MSSDSDAGEGLNMSLALPVVSTPNFNPNAVPTSPEEYLQQVIFEAKQCSPVVTVELDPKKVKKINPIVKKQTKMAAPKGYSPTTEVQKVFLAQFSDLREKIDRCRSSNNIPKPPLELPIAEDREAWCLLCFGNSFQRNMLQRRDKSNAPLPELIQGQQPLLSILLNISPVCLENLIESHSHWMEVFGFSEDQGRWFFSLLACLQKPLTPEMCSQLRHILVMSATLRASLESSEHPHLLHLNMLITIIAKYFNQDDLADS